MQKKEIFESTFQDFEVLEYEKEAFIKFVFFDAKKNVKTTHMIELVALNNFFLEMNSFNLDCKIIDLA